MEFSKNEQGRMVLRIIRKVLMLCCLIFAAYLPFAGGPVAVMPAAVAVVLISLCIGLKTPGPGIMEEPSGG